MFVQDKLLFKHSAGSGGSPLENHGGREWSSLELPQALCFGYEYDHYIQAVMKNRRDPSGLLTVTGVAEIVQEIDEAYEEENDSGKAGDEEGDEDDQGSGNVASWNGIAVSLDVEIDRIKNKDKLDETGLQKLAAFRQLARTKVQTHVEISVESLSDVEIITAMKNSAAGKLKGDADNGKPVGIFYDVKLCGQGTAHAHVRPPSLRGNGEHLKRLLSLTMQARGGQDEIADGDMYFLYDAGKSGPSLSSSLPQDVSDPRCNGLGERVS